MNNYKFIKHSLDKFFSLVLLILCIPLFIIISLLILLFDGKPVFFIQERIGYKSKPFRMVKFRTLKKYAPKNIPTALLKGINSYVTKTGSILRKTSLDELPQLLNIFLGDMSFIGPRPLLWNQYDLMKQRILDKSDFVKPGITGLAQITKDARDNDREKLKLDKIYVKNLSLKQDFQILLKTTPYILSRFIH
jgi:O-antigen biosynthesis protein WbqP